MIEFLQNYHLAGIVIGLCTFLVIGLFHPLVNDRIKSTLSEAN